jgi:Protein of unknown function (DUF3551)
MLKFSLLSGALLATGLFFTWAPAAHAQDYKWCVQGTGVGYPGDCSFATRAQCMAAASGRLVDCAINPRFAYGQQNRRPRWR